MQRKTALNALQQRSGDDWLLGYSSQAFWGLAEQTLDCLRSRPKPEIPLTILLAERDPLAFLAHFIAACAANCCVVLANPDWAPAEWQQVFELVQPDVIWGKEADIRHQTADGRRQELEEYIPTPHPTPYPLHPIPQILIPTGGTSGNIHFAIHTWETLMASVDGFCQYFEVKQVNSFCVLPLYHVSGLMQFLRSFSTGGQLVVQPFKAVERRDRPSINPEKFFLSLVPTQLQRLLGGGGRQQALEVVTQNQLPTPHSLLPTSHSSIAWLSRFHTVLLGGAPAWSDLLEQARYHRIRLAPTYGMTETASQIATLKPDDFLKGQINAGQVLPHAQITIRNPSGEVLPPYQIGNVTIQAKSLAIGYYPLLPTPYSPLSAPPDIQPDDLGFFDAEGYLHIVGRQSDKIITGGENVFPSEVEAAIRSTNLVHDVCVIGTSDRHWGQAITAVYVPIRADTSTTTIQAALENKLSRFKHPKHWITVDQLPRNAQGKVNRSQVAAIARQAFSSVPATD